MSEQRGEEELAEKEAARQVALEQADEATEVQKPAEAVEEFTPSIENDYLPAPSLRSKDVVRDAMKPALATDTTPASPPANQKRKAKASSGTSNTPPTQLPAKGRPALAQTTGSKHGSDSSSGSSPRKKSKSKSPHHVVASVA